MSETRRSMASQKACQSSLEVIAKVPRVYRRHLGRLPDEIHASICNFHGSVHLSAGLRVQALLEFSLVRATCSRPQFEARAIPRATIMTCRASRLTLDDLGHRSFSLQEDTILLTRPGSRVCLHFELVDLGQRPYKAAKQNIHFPTSRLPGSCSCGRYLPIPCCTERSIASEAACEGTEAPRRLTQRASADEQMQKKGGLLSFSILLKLLETCPRTLLEPAAEAQQAAHNISWGEFRVFRLSQVVEVLKRKRSATSTWSA